MAQILIFCWAILAGGLTLAGTEVYKWTDAEGVTSYSQLPPTNTDATRMSPSLPSAAPPASSADAAPAEPTPEPPETTDERKPADPDPREQARRRADEAAVRKLDCAEARERLQGLQKGGSLRVREEDGASRRLDPEERGRLTREAQDAVKQHCN